MDYLCLDFEGVLIPEIWQEVSEVTGYISDIGGFMGAVASLMSFIFGVFNYQYFETFMISKLYKKLEKPEAHALKR